MSDPSTTSNSSSGSGLPENVAGALAYFLGPLTGILFFIIDRRRPFVRFHALQAIGVCVLWVGLSILLMILSVVLAVVPLVGWLVDLLVGLGISLLGFALWLWLMYQAWSGRQWEFPAVGPYVRKMSDGMS